MLKWARKCPFFFATINSQSHSQSMNNVWQEILQEALNQLIQRSNTPVAGAKLRSTVAQIARDRGLEFLPTGVRKFSELVEAFPADFIVQRHPGSDILVVPTARAELLAAERPRAASSTARVRQDLFDALIRVPQAAYGLPYYDPTRDAVLYVKEGEEVPASAVAIPPTSLPAEIQLRRQFIAETELVDAAKEALTNSLVAGSTPLRDFSNSIQEFGLVKRWHSFRVALLAKRLREWSVDKALTWQPSWVDASEPRLVAVSTPVAPVSQDEKRQLSELASALTMEDLCRITIPMDIVLRLLAKK